MQGRTVLVTGGASFIGSHVAEAVLNAGGSVIAYDNLQFGLPAPIDHLREHPRLTVIEGDIRDVAKLSDAARQADGLVHLAAFMTSVIVRDPVQGVDVNVNGACTALRCAAEAGIKQIVLGSSVAAYGYVEGEVDETCAFTLGPLHWGVALYGYAKLVAEQFGRMLADRYGINLIALRYATVYGSRQHWRGVDAPFFIRTYERLRRDLAPQVLGDGLEAHDYIDVRDVAVASVRALAFKNGFDAINVATGRSTSLNEIIAIIQKLAGKALPVERIPVPAASRGVTASNFRYSTKMAEQLIDFTSQIDLERGLSDLFAWWEREGAAKYPEPIMQGAT